MSENVRGSGYPCTIERDLAAYDQLPPAARRAIAEGIDNWAAVPLLKRYLRGKPNYRTGDQIAARIAQTDQLELADREDHRARAIGVYKGNVSDAKLAGEAGDGRLRRRAVGEGLMPGA
jgi:hypothetical protein